MPRWFILGAVLFGLLAVTASIDPARATTLSASVSEADCLTLLDSDTTSSGTASAFSALNPPEHSGSGSGTGSAFASGGEIGGHLQMSVTGIFSNSDASMGGCFDASMIIDDILFSGPGSEVDASVAIDVDGIISLTNPGAGRSFTVTVQLSGAAPGGGTVFAPSISVPYINSVSTTLVTSPITVLTGQPVTVEVILHGEAGVSASTSSLFGATQFLDADFSNTVSFTTGGAVFNLPSGFTANSTDGNIVDNLFVISTVLAGDFDLDGDVDGFDFLKWQRGESPNPLSQSDLADWEANYGTVAPLSATSTAVPEPATFMMLLLGMLAVLFSRDVVVS